MKIINQVQRDDTASASALQTTTIDKLTTCDEIPYGSLIHLVVKTDPNTESYQSYKVTVDTLQNKMFRAIQNEFKTAYWDTHESGSTVHDQFEGDTKDRPPKTAFKDLLAYLKDKDAHRTSSQNYTFAPTEVVTSDPDGFIKHIYYDFDLIKRYMVSKDGDISHLIEQLQTEVTDIGCFFASDMKFSTTALDNNNVVAETHESVNHDKTENDTYCQMSIKDGNKISNTWTCTQTGNLVVYGWVDSSACLNNKATPGAFAALEGMINGRWEIISVCPVTPAKNMTYVGFNVPVRKGLEVRVRTGFECGGKSGHYSNEQDGFDTLSNSTVNGFKCMIYMHEKGTYK